VKQKSQLRVAAGVIVSLVVMAVIGVAGIEENNSDNIIGMINISTLDGLTTINIANGTTFDLDNEIYAELQKNGAVPIIVILKELPASYSTSFASKDGSSADLTRISSLGSKKRLIGEIQDNVLSRLNIATVSEIGSLDSTVEFELRHKYSSLNMISGIANEVAIEKLLSDSLVERVIIDRNNIEVLLDDSVPLVRSDTVWPIQRTGINLTGSDQSVCVIDTGVNYNHAALGGGWGNKVVTGYKYIFGSPSVNCTIDNSACYDNHGHGTHCAGIVASMDGTYTGVALDANIVVIKVSDTGSNIYSSDIIAGINYCISNAAKYNISTISISLGGGGYSSNCDIQEPDFATAIDSAVAAGLLVSIASGNDGYTNMISAPACITNATSVGGTYDANVGSITWGVPCTDNPTYADLIVCHTNRASFLDILAPGALIKSTSYTGGFVDEGGTSMAAPHVAGAAALMYQSQALKGKPITPDEVRQILKDTGADIGYDWPRLDVLAAIIRLNPLVATKSAAVGTVNISETITYTLNITNRDSIALSDVIIEDSYNPLALDYQNANISPNHSSPGNLTWVLDIPAGASVIIQVNMTALNIGNHTNNLSVFYDGYMEASASAVAEVSGPCYAILGSGVCLAPGDCACITQALNDNENCYSEVRLSGSVYNESATCINNPENFSDKVLDCQGHTIGGNHPANYSTGIVVEGKTNFTVANCVLSNWNYGMYLGLNNHSTISNNSVSSSATGIFSALSSNMTFYNNSAVECTTGFQLVSSYNNTINSFTSSSNMFGISLIWTNNSNFFSIDVTNSSGNGIRLDSECTSNTFSGINSSNNAGFGFLFSAANATGNIINDSVFCFNAVDINDSDSNSGSNNTCDWAPYWSDSSVAVGCANACRTAPLILIKEANVTNATVGRAFNYTITINNTGGTGRYGLNLTDVLNLTCLEYISASPLNDSPALFWNIGNLAPDSGVSTYLITTNATSICEGVPNTATLRGANINETNASISIDTINHPPEARNVTLSSSDPLNRANGTLTGSWSYYDWDAHLEQDNQTRWYNGSEEVIAFENFTEVLAGNLTKNQNWTFSVRVYDGYEWGNWSNASLVIANALPVIEDIENITLRETETVWINISADDNIDNDPLDYYVNSSLFDNISSNFNWTTNLSSAGDYVFQVNVSDGEENSTKLVYVTVLYAPDFDGDGNPDFNDTDIDGDGIPNEDDYLLGNATHVASNINFSIHVNGSVMDENHYNGTALIEFLDENNQTIIEFDWEFSNESVLMMNWTVWYDEASGKLTVWGLDLLGGTKAVYVNRPGTNHNYVCIADDATTNASSLTTACPSPRIKLQCDGVTRNGRRCTATGSSFRVTGLFHSAVAPIVVSTGTPEAAVEVAVVVAEALWQQTPPGSSSMQPFPRLTLVRKIMPPELFNILSAL
jgi:uncharacterized repeat protein (TIGR01451 family)